MLFFRCKKTVDHNVPLIILLSLACLLIHMMFLAGQGSSVIPGKTVPDGSHLHHGGDWIDGHCTNMGDK